MRSRKPYAPPVTVTLEAMLAQGNDRLLRETIYAMVLVAARLQTCREAFGSASGLSGPQFAVLMGVAHLQGETGVSIAAIASHVHLASTHVTTEVGRLHLSGLVAKRPAPKDRRSVLISLSEAGEATVEAVVPFVRTINDRLFDGLRSVDLRALHDLLATIGANSELALAEIRKVKGRLSPDLPPRKPHGGFSAGRKAPAS